MTQEQREQFELFKNFVRKWINEDCQSALEKAGARFLVLMGILNYIEIMGALVIGKWCSPKRFEAFLPYLGQDYNKLLELPNMNIYDELRCGFSHELLPKSRGFYLYEKIISSPSLVMGNRTSSMSGYIQIPGEPDCGIIFKNGEWYIILSKLLEDYKNAVEKLIKEIEIENCRQERLTIFFCTLNRFNFKNLKM